MLSLPEICCEMFETLEYIHNNIEMLSLETIAELYEKNEFR